MLSDQFHPHPLLGRQVDGLGTPTASAKSLKDQHSPRALTREDYQSSSQIRPETHSADTRRALQAIRDQYDHPMRAQSHHRSYPQDSVNFSLAGSIPSVQSESSSTSSSHTRRHPSNQSSTWSNFTMSSTSSSSSLTLSENITPSSSSIKVSAPNSANVAQGATEKAPKQFSTPHSRFMSKRRAATLLANGSSTSPIHSELMSAAPSRAASGSSDSTSFTPSTPHTIPSKAYQSDEQPFKYHERDHASNSSYSVELKQITAHTPILTNHALDRHQSLGTTNIAAGNQYEQHIESLSLALSLTNSVSKTFSSSDSRIPLSHMSTPSQEATSDHDSLRYLKSLSDQLPRTANASTSTFFTTNSSVVSFDGSTSPRERNFYPLNHIEKPSSSRPGSPITPTARFFTHTLSDAPSRLDCLEPNEEGEDVEILSSDHVSASQSSPISLVFDQQQTGKEDLDSEDWVDAIEDGGDPSSPSSPTRSMLSRFLSSPAPSTSDLLGSTSQAVPNLIGIDNQRRNLKPHEKRNSCHSEKRNSFYSMTSKRRSKLKPCLSSRNSMISVLSLASNGSILSMSQTDDGLEYEDAADQAEWMDIDGGGAYEDLDKAEEIVREVSRQSAIDSTQALQRAAEARSRYSALSDAHRVSDMLVVTGSMSKRSSFQVGKESPETGFNRRFSNNSDTTTSSPRLVSRQGSRCGENCEGERCECHGPSNQQRDSTSSRGSRVMLFTRNSRSLWGRNSPRLEDGAELDPIVEAENSGDTVGRYNTGSPFSQESSSGHGYSSTEHTSSARWRPRPLFLKPVAGGGALSGFGGRSTESPGPGRHQSSSSGHGNDTVEASLPESQPTQYDLSSDRLLPGNSASRSDSSDSSKTFQSQDSQNLWPSHRCGDSLTGASIYQSGHGNPSGAEIPAERRITVTGDQNARAALQSKRSLVFKSNHTTSPNSFADSHLEQGIPSVFMNAASPSLQAHGSGILHSPSGPTGPSSVPLSILLEPPEVDAEGEHEQVLHIDKISDAFISSPTSITYSVSSASSRLGHPSSPRDIKTSFSSDGASLLHAAEVDRTDTTNATHRSSADSNRSHDSTSQESSREPRLVASRPVAPTRSQTFGRNSRASLSPSPPPLPIDEAASMPVKSVRGGVKKIVSVSPIPFKVLRDGSPISPIKTSFERRSHGVTSPGQIVTLADVNNPSALSSWPSWAGKSTVTDLDANPPHSAKTPSSSRSVSSPFSPGNSEVMEYALESGGRAFIPDQVKRADLWDASTSHSLPSRQRSRDDISLESQLQNLSKMSNSRRGSSPLLDVRREPGTDMKATLRMIKGRSKVISGPIKLDPLIESQALWKMISGSAGSDANSTGSRKPFKKK